jgi:hypothetical protein
MNVSIASNSASLRFGVNDVTRRRPHPGRAGRPRDRKREKRDVEGAALRRGKADRDVVVDAVDQIA